MRRHRSRNWIHQPLTWLIFAAMVAVADLRLPSLCLFVFVGVLIPAAWQMVHRRYVPLLLAWFLVSVALPGLFHTLRHASPDATPATSDFAGPGPDATALSQTVVAPKPAPFWTARLGMLSTLAAFWWFHNRLQQRRRRRLNLRRDLQGRVRRRTNQVKRANLALRREVVRRQETQHLLDQSETTFQALIQRMELQVTRKDTQGVITFANDIYCQKLGLDPTEVVGSTDAELFEPEIATKYREDDRQIMQTGRVVDQIEKHPTPDGKQGFAQVFKAPEYDKDGNCVGIQIIFWDITQKHLGELELRNSEARKRALFNSVNDAVLLLDQDGRVVESNQAAEVLFETQVQNRPIDDIAVPLVDAAGFPHPRDLGGTWAAIPRGMRQDLTLRRHDESRFESEVSIHTIPISGEEGSAVIVRDVTIEKQAIEALKVAKAAAEEANRTKTEFMASVSHELRTPLGGIMGLADLLAEMEMPQRAAEYVRMIRQSTVSLSDVIEDILDFAAIEAGRLEIVPEPIDLHRVVGEAFKSLAVRASDKPLELIFSIAPDTPAMVEADAKRIRQIVINLAGNAIKFTPHGEVAVRLSASSPQNDCEVVFSIEVADSGVGISEDKQGAIFTAFERGEIGTKRSFGGTGLGLSITEGLVRRMRGWIDVESERGKGSRFTCHLRLPQIDDQATDAIEDDSLRHKVVSEGWTAILHSGSDSQDEALAESLESIGISSQSFAEEDHNLAPEPEASSNDRVPRIWLVSVDRDPAWRTHFDIRRDRVLWMHSVGQPLPPEATSRDAHVNLPVLPSEIRERVTELLSDRSCSRPNYGRGIPASQSSEPSRGARMMNAAGATASAHAVAKLLLVDDSEVNRLVIRQQLITRGFTVETAENGEQAIEQSIRHDYDCILMDLQMPKMDGAQATVKILEHFERAGRTPPPVIALTAHVTVEHQQLCQEAGMLGFVTKPVRIEDLLDTIDRHVRIAPTDQGDRSAGQFDSGDGSVPAAADAPGDETKAEAARKRLLAHCGGQPKLAVSLCSTFLMEVPDLLGRIDRHLGSGDWQELKRAAHTLKSCLRYVAGEEDVKRVAELEALAKEGVAPPSKLVEEVRAIADEWTTTVRDLRDASELWSAPL